MPRLPDRFDLWVRQARASRDPARQVDLILGGLLALRELHFLNIGTQATPLMAKAIIASEIYALACTDAPRMEELIAGRDGSPAVVTMPNPAALGWCVEGGLGLLINPGEDAVLVPASALKAFHEQWQRRGGGAVGRVLDSEPDERGGRLLAGAWVVAPWARSSRAAARGLPKGLAVSGSCRTPCDGDQARAYRVFTVARRLTATGHLLSFSDYVKFGLV
ncbi:MAG: hypothetical protein WDO13_12325 [Verrucomicrobiota bacterium]